MESLKKLQVEEEDEEGKEQCSPVSVLDPPFEDDDDGHVDDEDGDNNDFDLECSYAIVQSTYLTELNLFYCSIVISPAFTLMKPL